MEASAQISELWQTVKVLQRPGGLRYQLGEALRNLRSLYSERERKSGRQSAGVQGRGTFERECIARGLKPRRVRNLIADYEIELARGVCADGNENTHPHWKDKASQKTSAEKRRAARARRPKRLKHDRWSPDIGGFDSKADDFFARFARLLPYSAAKAAFREAAKKFHPDHGGDSARMTALNLLWEKLEPFYRSADGVLPTDILDSREETIQ